MRAPMWPTLLISAAIMAAAGKTSAQSKELDSPGEKPVENYNYRRVRGPDSNSVYVQVLSGHDINTNALAALFDAQPIDIRRDNELKTLALCRVRGDGFKMPAITRVEDRANEPLWDRRHEYWRNGICVAEYVYVIPGETIVFTGKKHLTPQEEQEILRKIRECNGVQKCIQPLIQQLNPKAPVEAPQEGEKSSGDTVTPAEMIDLNHLSECRLNPTEACVGAIFPDENGDPLVLEAVLTKPAEKTMSESRFWLSMIVAMAFTFLATQLANSCHLWMRIMQLITWIRTRCSATFRSRLAAAREEDERRREERRCRAEQRAQERSALETLAEEARTMRCALGNSLKELGIRTPMVGMTSLEMFDLVFRSAYAVRSFIFWTANEARIKIDARSTEAALIRQIDQLRRAHLVRLATAAGVQIEKNMTEAAIVEALEQCLSDARTLRPVTVDQGRFLDIIFRSVKPRAEELGIKVPKTFPAPYTRFHATMVADLVINVTVKEREEREGYAALRESFAAHYDQFAALIAQNTQLLTEEAEARKVGNEELANERRQAADQIFALSRPLVAALLPAFIKLTGRPWLARGDLHHREVALAHRIVATQDREQAIGKREREVGELEQMVRERETVVGDRERIVAQEAAQLNADLAQISALLGVATVFTPKAFLDGAAGRIADLLDAEEQLRTHPMVVAGAVDSANGHTSDPAVSGVVVRIPVQATMLAEAFAALERVPTEFELATPQQLEDFRPLAKTVDGLLSQAEELVRRIAGLRDRRVALSPAMIGDFSLDRMSTVRLLGCEPLRSEMTCLTVGTWEEGFSRIFGRLGLPLPSFWAAPAPQAEAS